MSWIKDGSRAKFEYCGKVLEGIVLHSRVKYGGAVQYTVLLDEPVSFKWSPEPKDMVLVDSDEVLEIDDMPFAM